MAEDTVPAYVKLLVSGRFDERLKSAYSRMRSCDLCPRRCGVNRLHSNRGAWCRTGSRAEVASFGAHFGEEQPLVELGHQPAPGTDATGFSHNPRRHDA